MQGVGAVIQRHEPEIVRLWADEAERAASARGLSRPEFENVMPRYVSELTKDGDHLAGHLDGRRRALIENHLATRLRQGFNLAEVIEELAILGRVVAHFCDREEEGERPSVEETRAFFAELAEAASMVAESFRDHLLKDEQADKRYVRLLEQIASQALQPGASPFAERLNEVLALIAEAMSANAAALLLYDAETNRLITRASAGIPGAELERYSATLAPSSFAGLVASSDEPTSILDSNSTHLDVSEGLRKAGIESLVGVRLLPHRTLAGVLLLGRRKHAHLSLADHVKLETLAGRLALHLENARLYAALQAKVAALTAERALRERFVSVLAHDLRGPLSTAKTGARLLVTTPRIPDGERAIASRVDKSLDRAERMIRDLLDANRVRAGEKLPLLIDEIDPAALAHEVTSELSDLHGRRFAVSMQAPPMTVFWSGAEVQRALWNLLTNAVKYGAPDSLITVRIQVADESSIALSVHNWGPPIPADDQQYIFDPFVRTRHAKAQGPGRGWGLGLTLVRGCAEAHGGSVRVTSSAGDGTTFTMLLPRDARTAAQPAADDRVEASSPRRDMRGNVGIRADALALHDDVKKTLRTVLYHIARLDRGDATAAKDLRTSLDELVAGLRHLYAEESRTLEPALRSLDAWGERHVEELHAQHDRELARVDSARVEALELAKQARAVVRVILRALRLEATTVLDQDRWSDDLTSLDQETG